MNLRLKFCVSILLLMTPGVARAPDLTATGNTPPSAPPSFIKDYYGCYLFWFGHYIRSEGPTIPPDARQGG
jgi:hypothetical protein